MSDRTRARALRVKASTWANLSSALLMTEAERRALYRWVVSANPPELHDLHVRLCALYARTTAGGDGG